MDDTQGSEFESTESEGTSTPDAPSPETSQNAQEAKEGAEAIADLSKFSRVVWKGKEVPVNDLVSGYARQSSLQKQVQQFEQERKYITNLEADLRKVVSNPALVEQFKQVYPAQYHRYLELVTGGKAQSPTASSSQSQQTPPTQSTDPRFEKVFATVEALERERFEEKVQSRQVEIDSAFTKYTAKYPLATPGGDESYVLTRAQALVSNGGNLDDKQWEKIFKDAHARNESAYESHYKTKIKQQTAANARGTESARGGGIPGNAPRGVKTLKEATQIALQDLAPG